MIVADKVRAKVTQGPKVYGRLTVIPCAISFSKKHKDGTTTWVSQYFDIKAFGEVAETLPAIDRGSSIVVCGRVELDEYNGKKRWGIIADSVELSGAAPATNRPETSASAVSADGTHFDCPF